MLILFTYKLLKGYLTCLKLNQFGFRWMCSRRILGDITPRTPALLVSWKGLLQEELLPENIPSRAPYAVRDRIAAIPRQTRDLSKFDRDSGMNQSGTAGFDFNAAVAAMTFMFPQNSISDTSSRRTGFSSIACPVPRS